MSGVASGVARHLGWPVALVRLGFVALTMVQFVGVIIYGLLWVLVPKGVDPHAAPGLESANRRGMRDPAVSSSRWRGDSGLLPALAAVGVGIIWLTQATGLGVSSTWFWPFLVGAAGIALIWRQADDAPATGEATASRWLAPLVSRSKWASVTRIVLGVAMVNAAVSLVVANRVGVNELPAVLAMGLLIMAGVGVAAAPWLHRMQQNLKRARDEKLVSEARADMAAHLHDSVLQTLALIQRQAGDQKAVASLARRQERELRAWLYADPDKETTLKAALTAAATEVEAERGVPIELVCVGDAPLTRALSALVESAREAIMNAAKHSGADLVDVFAEVDDSAVEVFVRDRGAGFQMSDIGDDRMGVKQSIIARMERHGGSAQIRSGPDHGTEIRLEMKV